MKVIIEGPDGSGKSTLVQELAKITGWKVVLGEGPEKHPGEMLQRIKRILKEGAYAEAYSVAPRIFDRHSCVSHPIYSRFTNVSEVPTEVTDQLYDLEHLIVYCQAPTGGLSNGHEVKGYDTEDHLKAIMESHDDILEAYDQWALKRAHLIHRFWDPHSTLRIASNIIGLSNIRNYRSKEEFK